MKGLTIFILALVLASSFAFAQIIKTPKMGEEGAEIISHAGERGPGIPEDNASQLRELILQVGDEGGVVRPGFGYQRMETSLTQNRIRTTVHALLAMENFTGGVGRNISAIAREFNNSVQATIRAEERIENRNWFARFFAGGDSESAEEIEAEVNRNQERIQELKRLRDECDCEEEVKGIMQEQIMNMEQEQNRLQELAQKEKQSKGLFGWIWKRG